MPGKIQHVAVGAVFNEKKDRVLVSKRHIETHQGGLWEFPGGKLEDSEDVESALKRELLEETGLHVGKARPLIKIRYDYTEKSVLLDVWRVDGWDGHIHGREGQQVEWVSLTDLSGLTFPPADRAIITAVRLPLLYQISPDPFPDTERFIHRTEVCLRAGVRLFQLRCKNTSTGEYRQLVQRMRKYFDSYDAILLINASPADAVALDVRGVHLTSERLMQLDYRPLNDEYLVAASCHNQAELDHAGHIGVDFAVLGPVNKTGSHPDRNPIGWNHFRSWTETATMPVYALGGMGESDLDTALAAGGQGIAMLDGIWSRPDPAGLIGKILLS